MHIRKEHPVLYIYITLLFIILIIRIQNKSIWKNEIIPFTTVCSCLFVWSYNYSIQRNEKSSSNLNCYLNCCLFNWVLLSCNQMIEFFRRRLAISTTTYKLNSSNKYMMFVFIKMLLFGFLTLYWLH